jgi:hypothetical protein
VVTRTIQHENSTIRMRRQFLGRTSPPTARCRSVTFQILVLRDNSNTLINRTIQLVNIRLEDHGKAILVFTIITIIFLPLSFVSSFFGMNFADIRDMDRTQGLFWIIAGSLTAGTVAFAMFLAFYGSSIVDWFVTWKEDKKRRKKSKTIALRETARGIKASGVKNFEIFDTARPR